MSYYFPSDGNCPCQICGSRRTGGAGNPLFKVADMEQVYLRVYITSEQLAEVKLGQQVTVYSDYGKEVPERYTGIVTWISVRSELLQKLS